MTIARTYQAHFVPFPIREEQHTIRVFETPCIQLYRQGLIGGGIPIGVGAGLGIRIRGGDQVVALFFSAGVGPVREPPAEGAETEHEKDRCGPC